MFYLSKLVKMMKTNTGSFIVFGLSSSLLLLAFFVSGNLSKHVISNFSGGGHKPYFYALINKRKNINGIKRKIQKLPGVDSVQSIPSAKIELLTQKVVIGWRGDIPKSVLDKKYWGVKIVYGNEASPKSQKIIKEYLIRLTGKGNISTTQIKRHQTKTNLFDSKKVQRFLPHFIHTMAILTFILSLILIRGNLGQQFYLLELNSRRKNLGLKCWLFGGSLFFALVTAALGVSFKSFEILALVPFAVFWIASILLFRGFEWAR